jgi:hypothetical protein
LNRQPAPRLLRYHSEHAKMRSISPEVVAQGCSPDPVTQTEPNRSNDLRLVTGLEGGLLSRGHESVQPRSHSKDGLLKIAEDFIERAAALQRHQCSNQSTFRTQVGSRLNAARTSAPQSKSRANCTKLNDIKFFMHRLKPMGISYWRHAR